MLATKVLQDFTGMKKGKHIGSGVICVCPKCGRIGLAQLRTYFPLLMVEFTHKIIMENGIPIPTSDSCMVKPPRLEVKK